MRRLALIGFGGVGQALLEMLDARGEQFSREHGLDAQVVAISDPVKGAIYDPAGIDAAAAMAAVRRDGTLQSYPQSEGLQRGWDSMRTIQETNADTIIEVSPTLPGGQAAIDHCLAAFEGGKNVVTSNKGPVCSRYGELMREAGRRGVRFGIEGTVMSGTPTLRMARVALAGNVITAVRGILNGTTNYMLTRMEQGLGYQDALHEAQRRGYAEADPTGDVDGYDALYKIVVLANHVMRVPLTVQDVQRSGISGLTSEDIAAARAQGKRWKLVAEARRDEDGLVHASVAPVMLPLADPLASVDGALNAVTYSCDLLGPVTLVGAGAGLRETAYALVIDLINLDRDSLPVGGAAE